MLLKGQPIRKIRVSRLRAAQAGKPADVAHGVIYNLASPVHAVMNVRGTGQRSFARRLLRMFQARWALQHVNIRDVKIFFEVEDPANREEHVQAGRQTKALAGKKPASRFYIGIDPGKEPLSWHWRPSEIDELKNQWVGLNAASINSPDNYQPILDSFKAESAEQ